MPDLDSIYVSHPDQLITAEEVKRLILRDINLHESVNGTFNGIRVTHKEVDEILGYIYETTAEHEYIFIASYGPESRSKMYLYAQDRSSWKDLIAKHYIGAAAKDVAVKRELEKPIFEAIKKRFKDIFDEINKVA